MLPRAKIPAVHLVPRQMFAEQPRHPGVLLGPLVLSSGFLREEHLSGCLLVSSPLALGGLRRQRSCLEMALSPQHSRSASHTVTSVC